MTVALAKNCLLNAMTALVVMAMAAFFAPVSATELGATVTNIAQVEYRIGSTTIARPTGDASFIIEATRTPSTIEFFRLAPGAPDAQSTNINGSDYQVANGGFSAIGPVPTLSGGIVTPASTVALVEATSFFPTEVVFIRVADAGQNGDPTRIETINATLTTSTGDAISLRFYETGANTGAFFAYVLSTGNAPDPGDALLSLSSGITITARYEDPFDATEVSTDVAGVDPFGRVFDSASGTLMDGVTVTIVDDATGQPAPVFGIDGVSDYPSTVVTGGTVTDSSGRVYPLEPGEFRFPIMFPGTYRVVLGLPEGYSAPSIEPETALQQLPTAPYELINASFGGSFVLDGTGDVSFDIPVDPFTELRLAKTALSPTASIGDFVRYELTVENTGISTNRVRLQDTLPRGFRYQPGSLRADETRLEDPVISQNGRALTIDAGLLPAGEVLTVSYVLEVGPGAPENEAVNSAIAIDANGAPASNRAEAAILIEDDFLRDQSTILGRIAANACTWDENDNPKITKGIGVQGVRLYLETGATVTTDEDGLYHFEAVTPGTHVVQVDETTLPEGYELVLCEDNTRFAGRASSQFVDARGASLWRANFYLKGDRPLPNRTANAESAGDVAAGNDAVEHARFDNLWLDQQLPVAGFVYPDEGANPAARSVNLGVKHQVGTRVVLLLNGAKVQGTNFAGREVSQQSKTALSRWRGVDLLPGDNEFVAIVMDEEGNELDRRTRTVSFIERVERVSFVEEASILSAGGEKEIVIAVRVTDAAGRPVHAGRLVPVIIDQPYRAAGLERLEDALPLDTPQSARATFPVDSDGIMRIRLAPTTQTGNARVEVILDNGQREEFAPYLKPALREWIVVGLAEGGLNRTEVDRPGQPKAEELLRDGRAAVFAKGTVKGDWLVTIAGDTDKRRGDRDDDLFDVVDPDDRFPLYGDRSEQEFEAQSRYPVFLKAEKDAFQALVGDYDSGLTQSRLARYTRRLTGGRVSYQGETVNFTGFASDTNQSFVRDELAADGTSGPFQLSARDLVRNSDTLIIETRDRFRPDEVVAVTPLARYLDYDIDFVTGQIILRLPVPVTDEDFNNNVLVVEYETSEATERGVTTGGRAGVSLLDNQLQAGVSLIHESGVGEATDAAGDADLLGVDLEYRLRDGPRIRAEYAVSRRQSSEGELRDDAILFEAEHLTEKVQAKVLYSEVGTDFGLGQQSSAVAGARRYGGEVSVRIDEFTSEDATVRGERFVDAKVYREEALATGARRDLAEIGVRQVSNETSASVGLRWVDEKNPEGEDRSSFLATASAEQQFRDLGLTLRAAHDQPLDGQDGSTLFPARTSFGFDQRLGDDVTLSATHEIQKGNNARSANTIVGVTATPWQGGRVTASADQLTQDSGERIGATLGVDQQVRLSEKWSASFGVSRREDLKTDGEIVQEDDIIPDAPRSAFDQDGAFTSVYTGLGYRGPVSTGSARFELRKSEEGQRYTGVAGAAREVSEALSFAGAARYTQENNDVQPDARYGEIRLGTAWRPRTSDGLIILDRLDIKYDEVDDDLSQLRIVNNLALNALITERLQVSANHGIKFAELETGGDVFGGITQLFGGEARYDLARWLDVGMQGSILHSHNSGTSEYSYGPSIGVTPAQNVWLTLGYNVDGFSDPDFAAAEWTREGPYVRLRIKFDQHTADGLLKWISPSEDP